MNKRQIKSTARPKWNANYQHTHDDLLFAKSLLLSLFNRYSSSANKGPDRINVALRGARVLKYRICRLKNWINKTWRGNVLEQSENKRFAKKKKKNQVWTCRKHAESSSETIL